MRVFVNRTDYTVAFLDVVGTGRAPVYRNTDDVFEVEVAKSCLDDIDEEHYPDLYYDADQNIVYRDPNLITFSTTVGKDWLIAKLQNYSLVPPEARGADFDILKDIAVQYLGSDKVDEIVADDALSDADVANILSYISGEGSEDSTP
tara:strand:+ start:347 stop:787 length:441 start_codon:yes stop_codon:yes gene_type:complete